VYIKVKDDGYKLMVENPLDKTMKYQSKFLSVEFHILQPRSNAHLSIHVHVKE
jgi:hypothetical protein